MFDSTYKELSGSPDHVILGTRFVGSYCLIILTIVHSLQCQSSGPEGMVTIGHSQGRPHMEERSYIGAGARCLAQKTKW